MMVHGRPGRLILGTLSLGLLVACERSPTRPPEPAWVSESPLAAVGNVPTAWPDSTWLTASPESLGVSGELLQAATRRIEKDLPEVRALLVVVDGRLGFERYFGTAESDDPIEVKSITKSIVSALVGVAFSRGELPSLDDPIIRWLEPESDAIIDSRVRRITLRHGLSMTAGFEWQENGPTTGEWIRSANQVRYLLGRPLTSEPGAEFAYNTGLAHLIAVALARATGMDLATYADRMLFGPIGVRAGRWGSDKQGNREGGSELELTARDLARFGLLFLNRGRWKHEQVVPEAWVLGSTRPQGRVDYGYFWWYLPREWGGPAINALGYGGQLISIVPDANAVIVMGSTVANPGNAILGVLREYLLPAVRHRNNLTAGH